MVKTTQEPFFREPDKRLGVAIVPLPLTYGLRETTEALHKQVPGIVEAAERLFSRGNERRIGYFVALIDRPDEKEPDTLHVQFYSLPEPLS